MREEPMATMEKVRETLSLRRFVILAATLGLLVGIVLTYGITRLNAGSELVDVKGEIGAKITAIKPDGKSVCLEGQGDESCGILITDGEFSPQVGDEVRAVKMWLKNPGGVSTLAWFVSPS